MKSSSIATVLALVPGIVCLLAVGGAGAVTTDGLLEPLGLEASLARFSEEVELYGDGI